MLMMAQRVFVAGGEVVALRNMDCVHVPGKVMLPSSPREIGSKGASGRQASFTTIPCDDSDRSTLYSYESSEYIGDAVVISLVAVSY